MEAQRNLVDNIGGASSLMSGKEGRRIKICRIKLPMAC